MERERERGEGRRKINDELIDDRVLNLVVVVDTFVHVCNMLC